MLGHTQGEKSKMHDALKAPTMLLHGRSDRINTFYVHITTNGTEHAEFKKQDCLLKKIRQELCKLKY